MPADKEAGFLEGLAQCRSGVREEPRPMFVVGGVGLAEPIVPVGALNAAAWKNIFSRHKPRAAAASTQQHFKPAAPLS